MTEIPPIGLPNSRNILNFVFIVVSLMLSLSSLAFYSLWRASEVTQSIDSSRENQSSAADLVGAVLPTSKPPAPSFIYPPSGDEKNNWQTIETSFQTEVGFEMAYPKTLLPIKEDGLRSKENFWNPLLKYHFFINEADKKAWSECSKKYAVWIAGLQNPSSTNGNSNRVPPCTPSSFEIFSVSFDTAETPAVNSSPSSVATSANHRSWSIGNLIENGKNGEYGYEAKTVLNDSGLIIQVFLIWPSKEALNKTESLFGYDSKTLLNNLLTQMNFGEHGMYGKTN
ncbi:MAG TPA: hypothetical protein PKJ26_03085 [Candidatus Woesebacteria bacterium]|nr:hypothetical protein [Candidatus Woesebacteria bacterium]HNS65454.1 hypothetical protein [Candidatus Woesebacteria bacterium]